MVAFLGANAPLVVLHNSVVATLHINQPIWPLSRADGRIE